MRFSVLLVMAVTACEGCAGRTSTAATAAEPASETQAHASSVSAPAMRTTSTMQAPAQAGLPQAPVLPARKLSPDEQAAFREAATKAWAFVKRNYQPATGLVRAHDTYEYGTLWDVASALGSYYAAHGLGLVPDAEYHDKMSKALATLATLPLYEKAAFNKMYSAESGAMVDRNQRRSTKGYGWSALDLGRLLVMLHVIATGDPAMAPAVQQVVSRLDMKQLVKGGYLQGSDLNLQTNRRQFYQEGRIGYEQYAAEGFALWGARADRARDFRANAKPVDLNGRTIYADRRGDDLLTSEPFVMMGLELGFPTQEWRDLATAVLGAQEARWHSTGTVTMLSEDAIPDPPAYFYYYLLYRNGKSFGVYAPGGEMSERFPRWVSTKAAWGWHALMPSEYTKAAIDAVKPAGTAGRGWTAGVYEGTNRSTRSYNLNSSAIVLESAYYAIRGCPLVNSSCPTQ